MYKWILLRTAALAVIVVSAQAQNLQRRATIMGGGSAAVGKCTIEVVVDGAAEVRVHGDSATLHNIWGQPPQWRRFECTSALPSNPANFRFVGIDGRGSQQLARNPANGGNAVVRIDDAPGGAEGYTFDLIWGSGQGSPLGRPDRWETGNAAPHGRPGDRDWDRGRHDVFNADEAIRGCQDDVRREANRRFGTPNLMFRRTVVEDNAGRQDSVTGTFDIRRFLGRTENYRFSCSVNLNNGQVRYATIEQLGHGASRWGFHNNNPAATERAVESCQRSVERKLGRANQQVDFGTVDIENRPGGNDRIVGAARIGSRYPTEWYNFSCSVNLQNGVVRSVEVNRR